MKFETEFSIGQTVFVIYDNVIQSAIITKITFPEPSLIYNSYNDNSIICHVWPKSKGERPESLSSTCQLSIMKSVDEIGNSIDDLLDKMKKNSNCSGLITQKNEKNRSIWFFKSKHV